MKVKMVGLMVLVLHVVVLGGFLLMQGCTTGTSPVPWLNWPYGAPPQERVVFGEEDVFAPLPPAIEKDELAPLPAFDAAPYEHTVQPDDRIHVVQKGETLSGIAARFGTRWRELADYNQLSDPDRLQAGSELRIPGYLGPPRTPAPAPTTTSAPARTPASAPASSIAQGESYEIRPGDTLGAIAQRSGLTVAELKAANNLSSDRIFAGQTLVIPSEGRTPQKPTAAPRTQPTPAPAPTPAPRTEPTPSPTPAQPAPSAQPEPEVAQDAPQPAAIPAAAPVYEHVLYPGESIDDVARQYGSTRSAILELNNIADPSTLRPGTKLMVPMPD